MVKNHSKATKVRTTGDSIQKWGNSENQDIFKTGSKFHMWKISQKCFSETGYKQDKSHCTYSHLSNANFPKYAVWDTSKDIFSKE